MVCSVHFPATLARSLNASRPQGTFRESPPFPRSSGNRVCYAGECCFQEGKERAETRPFLSLPFFEHWNTPTYCRPYNPRSSAGIKNVDNKTHASPSLWAERVRGGFGPKSVNLPSIRREFPCRSLSHHCVQRWEREKKSKAEANYMREYR